MTRHGERQAATRSPCRTIGAIAYVIAIACALWLAASLGASAATTASDTSLSLTRAGPAETVFDWRTMRCEDWDIPDSAARAWRDSTGRIHLIASHHRNRAMTGSTLDGVRHRCSVVYEAKHDDTYVDHDDRGWIASTYAFDGDQVLALVHNEFQGHLRPAQCPARVYMKCWRNSLTMALSRDGGATFTHGTPPSHYVAGLPYPYSGSAGKHSGYFSPSNIIERDGYYYVFFWAEPYGDQRRGACLMRTRDLTDPRSWRAWDGSTFTIAFAGPDPAQEKNAPLHVCAPVGAGGLVTIVSSVTRHRPSGLYIAMMAASRPSQTGDKALAGLFFATSADLIHWSAPVLFQELPLLNRYDCSDREAFYYPSLIDPRSSSRNFEDSGDHPYLYLTKIYVDACKIGMRRDLVRFPVSIRSREYSPPLTAPYGFSGKTGLR